MKNTLDAINCRGCFYFWLLGEELKLKEVLTLTSVVRLCLNTYSIRICKLSALIYLSRKRELSMSSTNVEPIFSEISFRDATMTSPLSAFEMNILSDLNMPMLLSFGFEAIILADAILTSLI